MKKIAIVTILSNNLGNRLQNYALQEVLTSLGYEVETLQKKHKNSNLSRYVKYQIKKILNKNDWKFREFDRKINWSPYSLSVQDDKNIINEKYDLFVAGSDQVWNPNFEGTNEDSFLTFASKEKSISYAASFGVSELPCNSINKFSEYLKEFKSISVREKQGVQIVEQFEDCKADVVLDPTLLLTKNDWKKVTKTINKKNKYVLKYLLGDEQKECDEMISQLFGNIEIVDVKTLLSGKGKTIGPEEFLGLVMNAELICTDSFHASVFSTIFEKPFVIFERVDKEKDMSSRIDSLCELLSLEEHRFSSDHFDISKVLKPNYEQTFSLLDKERDKSLLFLKNAIEN